MPVKRVTRTRKGHVAPGYRWGQRARSTFTKWVTIRAEQVRTRRRKHKGRQSRRTRGGLNDV